MIEKVFIQLFFSCLASCYCSAQSAGTLSNKDAGKKNHSGVVNTAGKKKIATKPVVNQGNSVITIHFISAEDYWIIIDKKNAEKISTDTPKKVQLAIGRHRLSFKSVKTGATIDSSVSVTSAMLENGPYTYSVTFKSLVEPGKPANLTATSDAIKKSSDTTVTGKPPVKELVTINELSAMVFIPGGSFIMGVDGAKLPGLLPHTVTIDSIKFGKHEVTQQQWEAIMGYNNSSNKDCGNCPVENVSWNEVDSFIKKINTISHNGFRLPTEAEWEYTAKQGIKNEMQASAKGIQNLLEQTSWYNKNSGEKTHPVVSKMPLSGIYDLLGNVSEWCQDYYRPDYQKDNASNPRGPSTGKEKLVKGGAYPDLQDDLKPSLRKKEDPSTRKSTIGFRLVMEVR